MFILDKHIEDGYAPIVYDAKGGSKGETANAKDLRSVSKISEVPGYASSGSFHANITSLDIKPGKKDGATLTWNRMPDGCCILDNPLGFVEYDGGYRISNTTTEGGDGDILGSYDAEWGKTEGPAVVTGRIYNWRRTVSGLLGGSYVVKVLRIGASEAETSVSECAKYMIGCEVSGRSDWYNNAGVNLNEFDGRSFWNGRESKSYRAAWDGSKTNLYRATDYDDYVWKTVRLIAIPTGEVARLEPMEVSVGKKEKPALSSLRLSAAAEVSYELDGRALGTGQRNGGTIAVDLSEWWGDIALGNHTLIVRAKKNGYETASRIEFEKVTSLLHVQGKPAPFDDMPSMCRMADSVVVPSGATIVREVTNNGNDATPTWEVYEGGSHTFANKTKQTGRWGLNWRIRIDNAKGAGVAKVSTGVALGVVTKKGV